MLCTYLNFNSNILVLDEVFDSMDVTSCQQILELISNKLSDVKSIYVITHRQELNIPYDKIVTIIKDSNGISTIQ
jgi:ABC-type transport system involved in cytochrome bd biosynthesis fused ATPase/permease subunit